jgi:DNA-binding LacI/PurR family transcriptional regulator
MKPTLRQIAERTGYSISTISRSLANSPSISRKTREEVHKVATEIGYRPAARKRRRRKKKKTLHFALLADYRIGEFYASLFCGYRDASYKEDVRISLLSVRDQRSECVRFIQQIHKENSYDGFILFFPALDRTHYDQILKVLPKGFPVVSNALVDNPNIATVTFDGYSGGRLAAEHFQKMGYRRLGIIEGPGLRPESRFRSNGFSDFIKHHSEIELTWRFTGNYEYTSGAEAFQSFQKAPEGRAADAVFAANDSMASGFMEAARTAGLHIPEDVAVLGYDNLPDAVHRKPSLSSIQTDFIELGASSIRTLKNKLSKQAYKHGTLSLIPVTLVQRESTTR